MMVKPLEITSGFCKYFLHNPKDKPKGDDHIHVCKQPENATKRCGYNSVNDSKKCPLYKGVK